MRTIFYFSLIMLSIFSLRSIFQLLHRTEWFLRVYRIHDCTVYRNWHPLKTYRSIQGTEAGIEGLKNVSAHVLVYRFNNKFKYKPIQRNLSHYLLKERQTWWC